LFQQEIEILCTTPLAAALLITLLLFGLSYLQVRARAEAERSAGELRISEGRVRKTLTDRERAEAASEGKRRALSRVDRKRKRHRFSPGP
jgi:hypothetical protein